MLKSKKTKERPPTFLRRVARFFTSVPNFCGHRKKIDDRRNLRSFHAIKKRKLPPFREKKVLSPTLSSFVHLNRQHPLFDLNLSLSLILKHTHTHTPKDTHTHTHTLSARLSLSLSRHNLLFKQHHGLLWQHSNTRARRPRKRHWS